MKDDSINQFENYAGGFRRVIHAPGALSSWEAACRRLKVTEAETAEGRFIRFFEMWANDKRPPSESIVKREGDLPDGTAFYALQQGKIRAYFWYSKTQRNTLIISHYVRKSWRKLQKRDIQKVHGNWRSLGEGDRT